MKEFDFNHPDFLKLPKEIREFMVKNYHKPLSEGGYVDFMRNCYKDQRGPKARKWRSKANLYYQYKRLNDRYGFFMEVEDADF